MVIRIGIGIENYKNQGGGGSSPSIVTAPVLSGLNIVGETLTSTQGTWSGTPPISYLYSFYADGVLVQATSLSNTYVIQSADSGKEITCLVDAANDFGSGFSESNGIWVITADLVNLQSYDAAKFTLSGSNIDAWTEQNGTTQWTSSGGNRPTLNSGVPTFAGSGTHLLRSSDISATVFCAYAVVRLTGETTSNQAIFAARTATDWVALANTSYRSNINIGGSPRYTAVGGYKGKRDVVFWIRRNGNTVSMGYNNCTLLQEANSFSGQNTLIGRLMGISGFSAFSMIGTLKSFVVTSAVLTDAQHNDVVSGLYAKYNLSSNVAADTVIAFGDSNTVGLGTTSYVNAVAASLGLAYKNIGISGSWFATNNSSSGYARYGTQVVYNPYTDYLVIQYGTNDILNSASVITYATEFNAMMSDLISRGWNPNRICLCSIAYQRDNANASLLDDYRAAILASSVTYGTRYFDLLQDMRDGGGNSLLSDNVHLNASGMTIWSNGVIAAFA